jgi:cytochrome c biogenesis protein CcmG/thiol:disulfide interchange protein DsbE
MFLRSLLLATLLLAPASAADDLPRNDQPRKPAPLFQLRDAKGAEVKLSDYRGKVVLLNFWATWCVGCKQEIPWFTEFQTKYGGKGLAVLGVSLDDEGWKVLKPWLAEHKLNYKVVLGNDDVAGLYGGVDALPTTLVIDRAGKVVTAHAGVVDRVQCEKDIQAALEEK